MYLLPHGNDLADLDSWQTWTHGINLDLWNRLGLRVVNFTYGRFHVKGPRKKDNVKKWIYFDEK